MSEQVNTPEINEALAKAEGVWKNLQKPILAVLVVALVIGGGYYGYKEYIQKPKEEKAADALFKA
ncbi:hypothetical protein ABTQ00_18975, partial [Acinetobacter baumannii]